MPDLEKAVAALPRRLCGLVFRPEGYAPDMTAAVMRACRRHSVPLVVAAGRVPPGAGRHLRRGYGRAHGFATSSAHTRAEVIRARRAKVTLVFVSPAFPTHSHPGAPALGPLRWLGMARGGWAAALGGIDGRSVRRLPAAVAAGAIGALLP